MEIMLTGSRCFPFVKHPHDFDVLINTEERIDKVFREKHDKEIREYLSSQNVDFDKETDKYDIFVWREEKELSPFYIAQVSKETNPYSFYTGKDLIKNNIDLLKERMGVARSILESQVAKNIYPKYSCKIYYTFMVCLYFIKNGFSSKFTEEQLDIINNIHDQKTLDLKVIDLILKEIDGVCDA